MIREKRHNTYNYEDKRNVILILMQCNGRQLRAVPFADDENMQSDGHTHTRNETIK